MGRRGWKIEELASGTLAVLVRELRVPCSIEFMLPAIGNEEICMLGAQGWILPFPLRLEEESKGVTARHMLSLGGKARK